MACVSKQTETDAEILIAHYPLGQAIEDGVLVEVFTHRWKDLTGGKPLVATAAVRADLSDAALIEIWNGFVAWRREVEPTLPEANRLFASEMNGQTIWVIEDGDALTILSPEDY